MSLDLTIQLHFSGLRDPRSHISRQYSLTSLLVIALCAVICGANSWVAVAAWGRSKEPWLRTLTDLPNGVPSHDTFSLVFSLLNPVELQMCFGSWTRALQDVGHEEFIALDGKTLRRSFDRAAGRTAIHMVQAWSSVNRLILAQVKTADKSNEITALPQLLALLSLHQAIVTIDAMGCQRAIAEQIVEGEGDYLLAVKGNQPKLLTALEEHFEEVMRAEEVAGVPLGYTQESDKGHGRQEERQVWVTSLPESLANSTQWRGLSTVAAVKRHRTVGGKTTEEVAFYISSLKVPNAPIVLEGTRAHWGVENQVHWCLDMTFREDESRIRTGHGPQNMAIMRQLALNLVRKDTTRKDSLRVKRQMAGWDNGYLLTILGVPP